MAANGALPSREPLDFPGIEGAVFWGLVIAVASTIELPGETRHGAGMADVESR